MSLGLDKSLAALGLDYVDLFLVHWPLLMNPDGNDDRFPKLPSGARDIITDGYHHTETWRQMEALAPTGRARAVGVSNYSVRYLKELLAVAKIVPAVNQIELHPALPQNDIYRLCREHGIRPMAYSPLGSTGGPLFEEETVKKVAAKHGVEPAAVLLSWHSKSLLFYFILVFLLAVTVALQLVLPDRLPWRGQSPGAVTFADCRLPPPALKFPARPSCWQSPSRRLASSRT